MQLAVSDAATGEVQAAAWAGVDEVEKAVAARSAAEPQNAVIKRLRQEITLFRRDPKNNVPKLRPSGAPPGPPV